MGDDRIDRQIFTPMDSEAVGGWEGRQVAEHSLIKDSSMKGTISCKSRALKCPLLEEV